ncbi:hypothetical protein WN944_007541 [Citrus x changshan-huyou]|uniref:Uncharacterized protein n=1 Tax=Citrus x changshan-huyou TaxID=2935761 RepID=A0AAP0QUC1_9ROSI
MKYGMAIFQKDLEIRKYELIELWMAQGYLNEKGNKEMEDIGEEYFNILASSSFFQEFNADGDGEVYMCKMHDLVHDLAQFIWRNECLTILAGRDWGINRSSEVTKLVVGGGYGRACSLGSLKKLNLLRDCRICGLGDVSNAGEARRAELEKKKNLVFLLLDFDHLRDGDEEQAGRREHEEDEDELLLEALGPPPDLKELHIHEYRGRRNVVLKNWVMSLTNLRVLYLSYCRNCEHLPPLGKLPSLEDLHILGMESVKRVGNKFLGVESDTDGSSVIAFPKLKRLAFHTMEELEEWDFRTAIKGEIIIMPRLSSLSIDDCPKLKALPDRLLQKTTLQRLEIYGCPILEERCRKGTGEDWPKIRHILDIEIE